MFVRCEAPHEQQRPENSAAKIYISKRRVTIGNSFCFAKCIYLPLLNRFTFFVRRLSDPYVSRVKTFAFHFFCCPVLSTTCKKLAIECFLQPWCCYYLKVRVVSFTLLISVVVSVTKFLALLFLVL